MAKVRDFDEFIRGFKTNKYSLENAPNKFFKDKETVLKLAPYDYFGNLYNYLPKKLQKDEDFISDLVNINGYLFLKANRYHDRNDMALTATKTCADAAEFLNLEGKDGLKLAKEAININAFAYRFIKNYTDNPEIITSALTSQGILYRYLTKENQLVEDYAKVALNSNPFVYKFLPKELTPNVELASIAIAADKGYAYSIYKDMLLEEVQANSYVSVLAISKDLRSILNVPNSTYADPEFQQMFEEMTEQTKESFRQQDDQEGLQNYESKLNDLVNQKNEIILEEKLNNLFSEKQKFDGVCEVGEQNIDETKNFVAPIDNQTIAQELEE